MKSKASLFLSSISSIACSDSSRIAILETETTASITYKELLNLYQEIASFLAGLPIRPGQTIAISGLPPQLIIATWLACECLELILVPVAQENPNALLNILEDACISGILLPSASVQPNFLCNLDIKKPPQQINIDSTIISFFHRSDTQQILETNGERVQDISLIAFTSGTTERSKGVALTRKMLDSAAESMASVVGANPSMQVLVPLSLSHMYGLIVARTHLMTGGALCLLPHSSTPSSILNAIQSKQLNALAFQPRHITALMQECSEKLSEITTNIQYIASASAGLDVSLLTSLGNYFQNTKIVIYYALTEAPRAVCAINPHQLPYEKRGTIGTAAPNVNVDIVTDEGEVASTYQTGEIVISGDIVALGYVRNGILDGCRFTNKTFFTGDLGLRDDLGLLYWRGRKRDQFQWAKLFCNPFDIEDQIRSQFSLQNVVVTKLNITPPSIGVFIEKTQDVEKEKEEEIIQVVRQWIADSIAPVTLKTYECFPRTSNGKVIRAEVLKLLS